jgi:putative ABC transport system permease protein
MMPDETGKEVKFRIVGTLQDSLFQSEFLMSDANFRKLYPHEEGFRFFLIDIPAEREVRFTAELDSGLRTNGISIVRSEDKVAVYQQVIGAYLSTFQLLGGLGLLLGVFGFGVVILRGVYERTGELALLRAVGYRTGQLQRIVLIENLLLLAVGLGIGLVSAIACVSPNAVLGGQVASVRLGAMLLAVALTGLAVAALATRRVSSIPLIPALRKE